ncbi:MAG: hypothetical protein SFY69_10760 [Planctomycetota bacterium]|nr:hypothetical protein [Planctomycetota bacterium]
MTPRPRAILLAAGVCLCTAPATRAQAPASEGPARASAPDPPAQVLRLRGGQALRVRVVESTPEALVVIAEGRRTLIGWERVADVPSLPPEMRTLADDAWRAASRVGRGDYVTAEPLLEELFPAMRGLVGPTPAAVASGLLKCRLARGAVVGAVEPMLALAASRSEGDQSWLPAEPPSISAPGDRLASGLAWDEQLRLSPGVPPMWAPLPSVRAQAQRGDALASGLGDGRGARLAQIYLHALRHEAGLPTRLAPRPDADEGVLLAHDVVAARTGDPPARAAAVVALRARLTPDTPAWTRAWLHAAVGRSMIRELETETKLLGVAELLRVPAQFERDVPYLTGLCLAEAAVTLHQLGEPDAANSLYADLTERFAGHPVLAWDALAPLRAQARRASPAPTEPDDAPTAGGPP